MPLHVAPHTKRFPAPGVRTFIRLLARVRIRVDLQTARPAERFVAGGADVAVLCLWEYGLRARADVVMVFPDVAVRWVLVWDAWHGLDG
jgi:hypothetical protein